MFKPGDKVVYPHHGAAIIEKKEKRKAFGKTTEYLVLRMAHGELTLSVPVENAEDVGMRWPISKEDVKDLFEVLQKRDIREPANWSDGSRTTRRNLRAATSTRWPKWFGTWRYVTRLRACRPAKRRSTTKP